MVKLKEEGTAPVSKYAAKKAKVAAKAKEVSVEQTTEELKVEKTQVEDKSAIQPAVNAPKTKGKTVVGKEKREINVDVAEHVLEVAYIVKDNAAIRRFTSLNILNYLVQVGRIKKDARGNYVKFLWNKFRVSSDGLTNEYSYGEKFFLKALIGAFGQFASNAQETIGIFMEEEGIDKLEE